MAASGADALDHIFGLLGCEAFGQGHWGDFDIGQAVGVMADATSQMDMAVTVAGIIVLTDAVFLHAGAIVDDVQ